MMREEASVQIEGLKKYCEDMVDSDESGAYVFDLDVQALDLALTALRPVSLEQVEKASPGCDWCVPLGVSYPHFCAKCGRPLTEEAVQMVLERLEALKDAAD